jgi:hypothetical protein
MVGPTSKELSDNSFDIKITLLRFKLLLFSIHFIKKIIINIVIKKLILFKLGSAFILVKKKFKLFCYKKN